MENIQEIKKIIALIKKIYKSCEKCKMTTILVGLPIEVKRQEKEWDRQHIHAKIKYNIFKRLGVLN